MTIGDKIKFGDDVNNWTIIGENAINFHVQCVGWSPLTRWVRRADARKVPK